MALHELAGAPPTAEMLVNVPRLITAYYAEKPDVHAAGQRVSFGTSGHRGSPFHCSFNEQHILAITQAICQYRRETGVDGPLFLAEDTHALSEPALATALEVLAANGVEVMVDEAPSASQEWPAQLAGGSSYLILTTSPGPMESSAKSAEGANGAKSRRRFVGPKRITKAIFRPAKFCWSGICWSIVIRTSNPFASAASNRRPFLSPARLA